MKSTVNGRCNEIPEPRILRRRAVGLAAAAVFVSAAWASEAANTSDSAPSDSGDSLENIIVTAQHRSENVQDVSSTVNVISGDTITTGEIRNTQDIILYLPNVTADTTDEHGRPKFYIRGIGLSDASIWNTNPIGVYQDDVYIWNSSTLGFPLFDLERVEVLSGPQGTLWGKNTTGGAIDFVSKKPSFDPDGYVKVSLGDYNDRLVEAAGGGALNSIFAARASVQTEGSDDFAQNSFIPGTTNRWSDSAIRLQLLGKFSDTFSALLNVHLRDFEGPDSNGAANVLVPTPGQSAFNTPEFSNPTETQTQRGVTLTLNKQFEDDLALTSITNKEFFHELDYGPQAAVTYNDGYTRTEFDVKQFSQEFRLASSAAQTFSWILGAYYFNGELDSNVEMGALPGTVKSDGSPAKTSYNIDTYGLKDQSYALFGNGDYKFTDRFDISAGLRVTTEQKKVNLLYQTAPSGVTFLDPSEWWDPGQIEQPLTVGAQQIADKTWSRVTYDFTPSYRVSDNVKVYFRNATGFDSGNFNATAMTQATVAVIQPETVISYEVGEKSEWLDDKLTVNGAIFYYDYNHIQQKSTVVSPINPLLQVITYVNAGAGYGKGVELEIAYLPIRNLKLSANIGLNNTKFTDFQDTPTHNSAGNWFNRVPRNVSNVGANYKFPLPDGAHLVLDTIWAYQSKEYFNAVSQVGYPILTQNPYWLGNLSAGYEAQGDKWELRGYLRNALNTQYENTALITGSVGYGSPRTFGVTGIVRF